MLSLFLVDRNTEEILYYRLLLQSANFGDPSSNRLQVIHFARFRNDDDGVHGFPQY